MKKILTYLLLFISLITISSTCANSKFSIVYAEENTVQEELEENINSQLKDIDFSNLET